MEIYEKAVGSVLLIAGLAIIGYSLNSGINIFIKGQNPPEIFKPIESAKPTDSNSAANASAQNPAKELPKNVNEINPADLQKMLSGAAGAISPEMIKSVIPPEIFNYAPRLMNYSVFSLFLWVLIIAGGKVSGLGISLIKTNSIIKF